VLVEVKTRLVDLQDLFAGVARKQRLVPLLIAGERGWRAANVGGLLVVVGSTGNRNVVWRHAATFEAAMPAGTVAVRRWLAEPVGSVAGTWFLPRMPGRAGMSGRRATCRVRLPGSAARR